MLAMARALCLEPGVLLLDEPTEGLMPSMLATIREVIMALRHRGVAILLVEQRVEAVLPVADRVAFIENGRIGDVVGVEQFSENHELFHKKIHRQIRRHQSIISARHFYQSKEFLPPHLRRRGGGVAETQLTIATYPRHIAELLR